MFLTSPVALDFTLVQIAHSYTEVIEPFNLTL